MVVKKCCLAAAIAGLMLPSIASANSVTMYGIVGSGYDYSVRKYKAHRVAANAHVYKKDTSFGLRNSGSRIGFKGSENLGNGLSAIFNLEMGFNAATGATSGGFRRRSIVGIKGGFGTIMVGRNNTSVDGFAMDVPASTRGDTKVTGRANGLFYRGQFSDVQVNAFLSHDSNKQETGAVEVRKKSSTGAGIGLRYRSGPIGLSAAFQHFKESTKRTNAMGAHTSKGSKRTEFGLAANYTIGKVRLLTNYVQVRAKEDDSNAYSQWQHVNLGAEYRTGPWRLMAVVGRNRAKARSNTKVLGAYAKHVRSDFGDEFVLKGSGTNFMVGAIYNLSKRTELRARIGRRMALKANVHNTAGGTLGSFKGHQDYVRLELRHKF